MQGMIYTVKVRLVMHYKEHVYVLFNAVVIVLHYVFRFFNVLDYSYEPRIGGSS